MGSWLSIPHPKSGFTGLAFFPTVSRVMFRTLEPKSYHYMRSLLELPEAGEARSGSKLQAANWLRALEPQMGILVHFPLGQAQTAGPRGQITPGWDLCGLAGSQPARGQSPHVAQRSLSTKYRKWLNEESAKCSFLESGTGHRLER